MLSDNPKCPECKSHMSYMGTNPGVDEPRHKRPAEKKYYCVRCQKWTRINV